MILLLLRLATRVPPGANGVQARARTCCRGNDYRGKMKSPLAKPEESCKTVKPPSATNPIYPLVFSGERILPVLNLYTSLDSNSSFVLCFLSAATSVSIASTGFKSTIMRRSLRTDSI